MDTKKYTGSGTVVTADFKNVSWVGKTKSGKAITSKLSDAIKMGNIDWTFAEKDDTVAAITFTATYSNTDATSTTTVEPWEIETDDTTTAGAGEIILGSGLFKIGTATVALTRGGGQFSVEREYREINADGDRGPVKDRIELVGSRATLTMNVLTFLTSFSAIYPAITVS